MPETCSLSSTSSLREGGFDFQRDRVEVRNGEMRDGGEDCVALNPKGT